MVGLYVGLAVEMKVYLDHITTSQVAVQTRGDAFWLFTIS